MYYKLEFESSLPLLSPSSLSSSLSLFPASQTPLIVAAKNGHFA